VLERRLAHSFAQKQQYDSLCKCIRTQLKCVRTQLCTASLSGACARKQMRDERSQLRERPGIGGNAFDRTVGA
jgi:hypothetical protein